MHGETEILKHRLSLNIASGRVQLQIHEDLHT